jgi:hypothetical protein
VDTSTPYENYVASLSADFNGAYNDIDGQLRVFCDRFQQTLSHIKTAMLPLVEVDNLTRSQVRRTAICLVRIGR